MTNRSKSETYEPPYEVYTSIFPDGWSEYALVMTGIQSRDGAGSGDLVSRLRQLLALESGPLHTEEVQTEHFNGRQDYLFLSYWRDGSEQKRWLAERDVSSFFNQPLQGAVGLWRESVVAPIAYLDPAGFKDRHEWGLGRHVKQEWERYHAYYGSMRDRMPHGHEPSIEGQSITLTTQPAVESRGKRLLIDNLPHNLCLIRGVFGWKEAAEAEREIFLDEMLPVYKRGVEYLRDHPIESSCITMHICDEVPTAHHNGIDAESIGWFTSLGELERWTHRHATHAAIFQKSLEIATRFNFKLTLNFGHEVIVVPKGGCAALYNNCDPATGFLPYFPARVPA